MTVDRPFVGGGCIQEAPGTCSRCVWGRGPHAWDCVKENARLANIYRNGHQQTDCVCHTHPEIAKRHSNCRMAALDVQYLAAVPHVVGEVAKWWQSE